MQMYTKKICVCMIIPVLRKVNLDDHNSNFQNLLYWVILNNILFRFYLEKNIYTQFIILKCDKTLEIHSLQ